MSPVRERADEPAPDSARKPSSDAKSGSMLTVLIGQTGALFRWLGRNRL